MINYVATNLLIQSPHVRVNLHIKEGRLKAERRFGKLKTRRTNQSFPHEILHVCCDELPGLLSHYWWWTLCAQIGESYEEVYLSAAAEGKSFRSRCMVRTAIASTLSGWLPVAWLSRLDRRLCMLGRENMKPHLKGKVNPTWRARLKVKGEKRLKNQVEKLYFAMNWSTSPANLRGKK